MRPFLLLFLLSLLLTPGSPAFAQLLQQRVYGSAGDEMGGHMTPMQGGGYLVVGNQRKNTTSPVIDIKLYLVRINAQGDTLWTRSRKLPGFTGLTVRGVCENAAEQVLVATDGGDVNTGTGFGAMLVLLNAQGDTLWTRKTTGPTDDYYANIVLGNDGNFVLTASLNTFPQWLKVNAAGQVVAQTNITYDATEVGDVSNVFKDNTARGGYWVLNSKYITGNERKLLHLTENGTVDQTKPLYGSGNNFIQSVAPVANQGGYMICLDGRIARFSATLDTVWTKKLPYTNGVVSGFAVPDQVQPLVDGNFVLAGKFYNSNGYRVYLSKITPAGQVLRDTVLFRLGGSETISGLAVEPLTSNYVFTGFTTAGPLGNADLLFGRHAHWRVLNTRTPTQAPVFPLTAWPTPLGAGVDELQVRSGQALAGELLLCDELGRSIYRWPAERTIVSAEGQRLNLAGVPAGMYLLTGTAADGRRYVTRVLRQ